MIRPATPADAGALARIRERAWHRAYGDFIDVESVLGLADGDPVDRWREQIASTAVRTLVWDQGGRVAGFASAGPSGEPGAPVGLGSVLALYVDPPAQGAGLGRALLAAAEDELRDRGYRCAELWVFARNEAARAFYERHGWSLEEGSQHVDEPTGADILSYRRDL